MGSRSFWLRVLNVYPEEWGIVRRLYLFQFFQGAGIAFFFTSAFSRFLERFPITKLPWVMVCSAVLLWLTGLIYAKLEHAIKVTRFSVYVIVFMAASILAMWVAGYSITADWFYYLVIAWFEVLYLLNNMEFWGIAALIFDLRQSKRLFAVISGGDIPAKFIGYTLAWIFVPYTGTQNLLLIGAACILISLVFFKNIVRLGKLDAHDHFHHVKHKKHSSRKIQKIVTNIATNSFVRRIAFISLLASTCVILINYGFYGEVKKAYHDDVELAEFVSFFYAGLRLIAFITKMIFTGRLTASMGVRSALFITPIGVLLLIGLIALSNWIWPQEGLIFYLFGVAAMLIDVLRTSFNSPVLLTLMQPLSVHERLRAHNIVKGIMDPFASFLSGIFLLTLFYIRGKVDLMFLCYVLMVLGGLWVIGVLLVNRQYLQTLFKTIGNRYFSSEEFNLSNETVIEQIRNKLTTGTEIEVINILRLLTNKKGAVAEDLIIGLLDHPSDSVKLEVLRLIKSRKVTNVKEKLDFLLRSNVALDVKVEAITTLCKIGSGDWNLAAYLADPRQKIRDAAIAGMLGNSDSRIKGMAEAGVNNLLDTQKKEEVISILSEIKDEYDSPAYLQLLNDDDPYISNMTIKAVGRACSEEALFELLKHINTQEKEVLNSLYNVGDKAIPILEEYISQGEISEQLKEKLIGVLGKIGGDHSEEVLLALLKTQPRYTSAIIKALHRCKYVAGADMQKQMEAIARAYIVSGVELLFMQQGLSKRDPAYNLLNRSLQYEVQEIREILLYLFGCIYDRNKINQVKNGLNMKHKESVANAMEIIELTVKKDIGKQFNTMFESTSIEQRCIALKSLFAENKFGEMENILGRILSEKPVHYYDWTKACSIYISKKYSHPLGNDIYERYVESESKLLKETALFAVSSS